MTQAALAALDRVAPPPVYYEPPLPEILSQSPAVTSENMQPLSVLGLPYLTLAAGGKALSSFGTGVNSWEEGAENGLTYVLDHSDASYSLIQSERVGKGSNAFHLANPGGVDNWFELDVNIDVLADTLLFFQSRLQWATPRQLIKVQVSHDGGSSWPDTIYSQAGSGDSGEGIFILRTVDLGASYANQQIRIRFYYDSTGSYYPQVTNHIGWLVDDVQIGTQLQKAEWSIGDPTPDEVLYLETINRARADAMVEAARLATITDPQITGVYSVIGINPTDIISQYQWSINNGLITANAQPLAFNAGLMETAQKHSLDMFNNEFQDHISSANPIAPFQAGDTYADRLARVGYISAAGENVYAAARSVEHGHAGFAVDWGDITDTASTNYNPDFAGQGMQNPAGHRLTIHKGTYNEIGLGVVNGFNGSVGPQIVTQDFGSANGISYITGIVYIDSNEDGRYTVTNHTQHEGVGGVRVDVDGSVFYTISTRSGAYAFPVANDGSYSVTFSGDGFEALTTTIVVANGLNTKFDFQPVVLSGYGLWAHDNALVGGPGEDDDLDGIANLIEYSIAGMLATTPDAANFPAMVQLPGGAWQFAVNKRSGAVDVIHQVELSTDLAGTWQAPGEIAGTGIVTDTDDELIIRIEATIPKIFLRLKVTQID